MRSAVQIEALSLSIESIVKEFEKIIKQYFLGKFIKYKWLNIARLYKKNDLKN